MLIVFWTTRFHGKGMYKSRLRLNNNKEAKTQLLLNGPPYFIVIVFCLTKLLAIKTEKQFDTIIRLGPNPQIVNCLIIVKSYFFQPVIWRENVIDF